MARRFLVVVNSSKDDFREFVDTLVVALGAIEKSGSPIRHIHPVVVKDTPLVDVGSEGTP